MSLRTESALDGVVHVRVGLRDGEERIEADASGNGPISAFLAVLGAEGVDVKLRDYVEHTLAASGDSQAAAYVELEVDGRVLWGVGIDADISTASLKAVVSAVNRALAGHRRGRAGARGRRGLSRPADRGAPRSDAYRDPSHRRLDTRPPVAASLLERRSVRRAATPASCRAPAARAGSTRSARSPGG